MDSAAQTAEAGNGPEFSFRLKPFDSEASGIRGSKRKGVFRRVNVRLSFELEARSNLGGAAYVLFVVALELEQADLEALVGFQLGVLQSRDHMAAAVASATPIAVDAFAALLLAEELVQTCAVSEQGSRHVVGRGDRIVRCASAVTAAQLDLVPNDRKPCARCFAELWGAAGGHEALRGAFVLLAANGGQSS